MKNRLIVIIPLVMLLSWPPSVLRAQDNGLHVTVVDEAGRPVADAEITVAGGTVGTYRSDLRGEAFVPVASGTVVTVSKVNIFEKRIELSAGGNTVRIGAADMLLDTGYDTETTKYASPDAIDGVGAGVLALSGQTDFVQTLYGVVPGLNVMQAGTLPWEPMPRMWIRGNGGLGGGSLLILVDGIERDASRLSRDEVRSITVMKDAASLAQFGNRGIDGVVNITTKRGTSGRLNTRINYSFGVVTPFRIPEMASPAEYASAVNEALANDGLVARYSRYDIAELSRGTSKIPAVDWRSQILRKTGFTHDLNLSFDEARRRMRYFVYANYSNQRGFLNNTKLNDGYSTQIDQHALKVRTNLEADLTRTTVVRLNMMGKLMQYQKPYGSTDLYGMYNTPAIAFPVKDDEGVWARGKMFGNPLAEFTARGYGITLQRTLFADLAIDQDLSAVTKGLTAQLRLAYDNSAEISDSKSRSYAYSQADMMFDDNGNFDGMTYTRYANDTELSFGSSLSWQVARTTVWGKLGYGRSFGLHNLSSSFVYYQSRSKYLGPNNTFMHRDWIVSAVYNYGNRYILKGVLNCSGSAKLPRGDKYRLYPAVSAAWLISNESFMKSSRAVNLLKLRVSFGITGSDARLSYDMDKQFNGSGGSYIFQGTQNNPSMVRGGLPSQGIGPEREYKSDIGIELGLFGELDIQLDGFYHHRTNIRVPGDGTVSSVLGRGIPSLFTGETVNRGGELSVSWHRNIGRFSYRLSGNAAYAANRVVNTEESYKPHDYMKYTGQPIDRFYGLVADGFYRADDFDGNGNLRPGIPSSTFVSGVRPGDVRYSDLNDDGRIDEYDNCYQLLTSLPEIYYGFTVSAAYANVGFEALFQGAARYTVTTMLAGIYQPLYGNDKNISRHYLSDYWSESSPDGRYPRLTTLSNDNNYRTSSLWTERGDYLKLRTLKVYYKLPERAVSRLRLREWSFYLVGMNLFSADRIGILDPEHISHGYPSARTYQIGINLIF